jgi:hypothetical protein
MNLGLKLLFSAKRIISDDHEEEFEHAVLSLCIATSQQVQEIKSIYGNSVAHIKPEWQDTFRRQTEAFGTLFQYQTEIIRETLTLHISQEKSQQASIERDEADRYYRHWYWEERPVISSAEALDALRRVKRCILAIYHLAALSATAPDKDQISFNFGAQLEGLPNEKLRGYQNSPKTAIPILLSTVASALDNFMISGQKNAAAKKHKEQAPSTSMFTRIKQGIFSFKRT